MGLVKKLVLRQYMLPYVGWGKTMLSSVFFYLTPINFLLLLVTAYHTTISPWAVIHAPWLNLWIFVLVIVAVMLIAIIVEYKLIWPSVVAFSNVQGYQHNSPFARDLQAIKKKLGINDNETEKLHADS